MADVYRVGVAIGMTDNATQALQALSRNILGVNLQAEKLVGGLSRANVAALGLTGVLAGGALLGSMTKLVGAGKEFVHQQSLMLQNGISQKQVAEASAAAWETAARVMGTSADKNLSVISTLYGQLGSMKEAIEVAPVMSRVGVVLHNLTNADQEKETESALKYLDDSGRATDPRTGKISSAQLMKGANLLSAIALETHGGVTPEKLLAFQTYARTAGMRLTDDGLLRMIPLINSSRSPSTVGTQLASLQQQLAGGVLTKAGAEWLEQIGVLDPKKVTEGRGGHMTFQRNAIRDQSLLGGDPVTFVSSLVHNGLMHQVGKGMNAQLDEILRGHLRGTTLGLLAEIIRNSRQYEQEYVNLQKSKNVDQYKVAQETDPTTKLNNFETAWHNLLTALGAPIVNDATGMIGKLTGVITTLTDTARKHPRAVADIELGVAGIAGLVALSGSIAVAGAALGPLASGLGALTGVLAGGEVASAVATAGVLGGGVAVGGSLLGVAAGITALGVAVLALPPAMKWLIDHFGVSNPHTGINARGLPYDHAPPSAKNTHERDWWDKVWNGDGSPDGWWGSIKKAWNTPAPAHANARGIQGHAAQHLAHGNLGPDNTRHVGTANISLHVDGRELARTVREIEFRDARQDMRASGTAPDLTQYPQVPGRSVGQ